MQPMQRMWMRRLVALTLGGALVGAGLGWLAGALTVPGYDASAYLLVTPAGRTPVSTSEVQYAQAISQVITEPGVLALAGDVAELPDDRRRLRADPSPNAPLIELTVNAGSAAQARRQVQAAADAVVSYTAQRVDDLGVQVVLLAPAGTARRAGLPLAAYLAAGAAMGAALGWLTAFLLGTRALPQHHALPARTGDTGDVGGNAAAPSTSS